MYKAVFQNSKVALVFAAMTVISAVSMVGTSDEGGLVTKVAEIAEARRDMIASEAEAFAESQGGGDAEGGSGESGNPSVFGDYDGAASAAPATPARPAPGGNGGGSIMTAPLASTAYVSGRGSLNPVPVPETEAEPVITDRDMTLAPE